MRILLDECLPRKLKLNLLGHDVLTVPEAGWRGLKNGVLLRQAESRFDVFVTIDQGLRYQQNLRESKLGIILLVVPNNRVETLQPLMSGVIAASNKIQSGDVIRVD